MVGLHPFAANHTGDADDNEGDAEQLSHVQWQAVFEIHLVDFGEFNEEAGDEDKGEAKSEEEARDDISDKTAYSEVTEQ